MSGDHYRCPVPGEDGVSAGGGGRLGAMLRAGACGMHADEAAVELLLRHGHWAGHGEFARRFAQVPACPDPGRVPVAGIDWQAAASGLGGAGLACSASEAGVLRIAARLGRGVPVSLRAVLGAPDQSTIAPVSPARLPATAT